MAEELSKRPFMRPLLIWIAGIILQSYCSGFDYAFILLLPVLTVCIPFVRNTRICPSFEFRWLWGLFFFLFLLFMAVVRTYSVEMMGKSNRSLFPQAVVKAEKVREELLSPVSQLNLSEQEKAVLSTITLGNRQKLNSDTRHRFSMAGAAHILSVSGFHVAVICGFLSSLFCVFPHYRWAEWTRYIGILILLWMFVFLSGLSASAVRSGLMLTLYMTGRVLERRADRYNIWAASAFLMLLYNPHYLFDIGFELSYLAVFFLFWIQPDIKSWIQVKNPLLAGPWDWLTITLAAQIGVTFLCMYYFQEFSTVFLLSAIPITLMATLLIPVALGWMLLSVVGWNDSFLQWGVEKLSHFMVKFVEQLSGSPLSSLPVSMNSRELGAAYGALILFILALKKRNPRYLIFSLFLGILFLVF